MEKGSRILIIILIIALALVSLFTVYENQNKEEQTMDVQGSYSTKVAPDQAEINFNVVTDGNTALEAEQKNSEISNNLIKALKASGLTDKDIETVNYYSNKKTVWENNQYVEKGFEVVNSMRIKTKNLSQVGSLIDLASKNGVDSIDSLSFTLSEDRKEQIYQDALAKASQNARERADKIAQAIGFKIKGVKSISLTQPITPIYYANAVSKDSMNPTPIEPQQVDLNVEVTVVFKIA